MISIIEFKRVTKKAVQSINELEFQLSSSHPSVSSFWLKQFLRDKTGHFLVVMDEKKIIGMGTMIIFDTLFGRRGRIEDVVIHEQYRGRGLGEKLVRKLISLAKRLKVRRIDLTSRPYRIAAHALYEKVGFKKYETNVYRMKL